MQRPCDGVARTRSRCPSGSGTDRPYARRDATAGDRSRSAAARAHSCWCGGRRYVCTSICWIFSSPARDASVDPLVRRIEATRVPDHADQAGLASAIRSTASASPQLSASGISTCTCLPAFMHCDRLLRVHLRRRAQNRRRRRPLATARRSARSSRARCRTSSRLPASARVRRPTSDTTSTPSIFLIASRCFCAERAGAGDDDLHDAAHRPFSRIRWPTAVFEAGT